MTPTGKGYLISLVVTHLQDIGGLLIVCHLQGFGTDYRGEPDMDLPGSDTGGAPTNALAVRTAPRRRRRMPSSSPMLLEARPPRQSVTIPTSQSGELYQNAKSRLCSPL